MIDWNSSARSTAWNGIPSEAATIRASRASEMEQHDFFDDSCSATWTPLRMKSPTRSRPSSRSIHAATELSTPPLMATTKRGLEDVGADMRERDGNATWREE